MPSVRLAREHRGQRAGPSPQRIRANRVGEAKSARPPRLLPLLPTGRAEVQLGQAIGHHRSRFVPPTVQSCPIYGNTGGSRRPMGCGGAAPARGRGPPLATGKGRGGDGAAQPGRSWATGRFGPRPAPTRSDGDAGALGRLARRTGAASGERLSPGCSVAESLTPTPLPFSGIDTTLAVSSAARRRAASSRKATRPRLRRCAGRPPVGAEPSAARRLPAPVAAGAAARPPLAALRIGCSRPHRAGSSAARPTAGTAGRAPRPRPPALPLPPAPAVWPDSSGFPRCGSASARTRGRPLGVRAQPEVELLAPEVERAAARHCVGVGVEQQGAVP